MLEWRARDLHEFSKLCPLLKSHRHMSIPRLCRTGNTVGAAQHAWRDTSRQRTLGTPDTRCKAARTKALGLAEERDSHRYFQALPMSLLHFETSTAGTEMDCYGLPLGFIASR